jgi:small subunit ribosomal protein S8
MVNKAEVLVPFSKIKEKIAETLVKERYIKNYEVIEPGKTLKLKLKYEDNKPAISHLKRISKPGCRIYVSKNKIPEVLNGYGVAILSTSSGIMTSKEAKEKQVGGELLCELW